MPDQLSDLLYRSVDDIAIPHAAAYDIIGRGRTLRRRRRMATGVVAAAAIIAAGVGGVLVADLGADDPRGADVAGQGPERAQDPAQRAYDAEGAWMANDHVTIGTSVVSVPNATHLAQTAAGVVAETNAGQGVTGFVLIRPDGTQLPLSIPLEAVHVEGDLNAPRVAWLEPEDGAVVVHVWDVLADREVGTNRQPSPGTRAGGEQPYIRVALLDGDLTYFSTDNDVAFQVNWRTGAATAIDDQPFSVHQGIATVLEGEEWTIKDMVDDRVVRRLGSAYNNPSISPDGTKVLLIDGSGDEPVASVEDVAGGNGVELSDVEWLAVWTRGGRVLSPIAGGIQVCDVEGTCASRSVDAPDGVTPADFLNVG